MIINTKEFIDKMQETAEDKYNTAISKRDCRTFLNAFFDTVTECLANGDDVKFTGFGSFEVRDRKERTCRNLQTGEAIEVPASKSAAFRVGKNLKDAVKGKLE